MRFFTSDTHFGHKRIIELCNRPFNDVHHMNEMLIANWNDMVAPGDTVYHLGDVALGPWVEWHNILTRLNGYKILVVGNHERIFKGMKEREQERFAPYYAEWFDEVIHGWAEIVLAERRVRISHFPYAGDSHGEDRYLWARALDDGMPLIHGHTHDSGNPVSLSSRGTPQFHVGVDAHGYKPVSELEVEAWLHGLSK